MTFPVYRIESDEQRDLLVNRYDITRDWTMGSDYPYYIRLGNFNRDGWTRLSRKTDEDVRDFYELRNIPIEIRTLEPLRVVDLDLIS